MIIGAVMTGVVLLALQIFFMRIGELRLTYIVERQLAGKNLLFSSGINQDVFQYKLKLLEKKAPEIVAIGSSRAMQMRGEFFGASFLNMGGTISHVSDLEYLAKKLASRPTKVGFMLLVVDPWWFNNRYPGAAQEHARVDFPDFINTDIISQAIDTLGRGNWLKNVGRTSDLGIHAILTHEGFAADGSYHYTDTISGRRSFGDEAFKNTLSRIENSSQRFEKNNHADKALLGRACVAINSLRQSAGYLAIIAPPFSHKVWLRMAEGGYAYIEDIGSYLGQCIQDVTFVDISDPTDLPGSNDCEFIDGFHGGDTTAARMLLLLAGRDSKAAAYISTDYLKDFLARHAGYAAGITAEKITSNREVDFMKIGCRK